MPNTFRLEVRKPDLDPRAARSTSALGRALIELVQERDFRRITVQQILDRAGVGRATFYAHYRNKEDVLHSSYEPVFAAFEALVERPSPIGHRLYPVEELLAHLAQARDVVQGLERGGQLREVWDNFRTHAARLIAKRLTAGGPAPDATAPQLAARMLAGALTEMIEWWLDHQSSTTPAEMDRAFHAFAAQAAERVRRESLNARG